MPTQPWCTALCAAAPPRADPWQGVGVQRATGCLCPILRHRRAFPREWHTLSGLGRTRSPQATARGQPATVHTSAHTLTFVGCTHAHQDKEQQAWQGHGQRMCLAQQGARTHAQAHG